MFTLENSKKKSYFYFKSLCVSSKVSKESIRKTPVVEGITLTPVCKKRKTDAVTCSSAAATLSPEPDPDKLESGDTRLTYDIGIYVKSTTKIPIDLKYRLLNDPYKPHLSHDFEGDMSGSGKRCFRESWLTQYTPWLSYSSRLKGAFCIFCVLFPLKRNSGCLHYYLYKVQRF